MKYLWRLLSARCTLCGQRFKLNQTVTERVTEINGRNARVAKSLGRYPQAQSCKKCHRIVFESEPGFVRSILLIDMDYCRPFIPPAVDNQPTGAISGYRIQQFRAQTSEEKSNVGSTV